MSLLEQLQQLDSELLALFADIEQLDPDTVATRLAQRARLLQLLIETEMLNAEQVDTLMTRSQQLTQQAEHSRAVLAEKLVTLQKGRRSVQAYGNVKKS